MAALPKAYSDMIKSWIKKRASYNSNSTIYLALLCSIYLFLISAYSPFKTQAYILNNAETNLCIEIIENNISTMHCYENDTGLEKFKSNYSLPADVKSGDRITLDKGATTIDRISGAKKISLGIPIGINSASIDDLTAIPGIGPALAQRIIYYRATHGSIDSIDELDNIEGIGSIKLETIKSLTKID